MADGEHGFDDADVGVHADRALARTLLSEAIDGLRMAASLVHEAEASAAMSRYADELTRLGQEAENCPG